MKKSLWFALFLALALLCGCSLAQAEAYPSQNLFYDEDLVYYNASANGTLYLSCDSGICRLSADGVSTCVIPTSELSLRIDSLLSDGRALYSLCMDNPITLTLLLDETGEKALRPVLTIENEQGMWVNNPVVQNGKLHFLCREGSQTTLYIHPLDGSAATSITTKDISCFDVMPDGRPLALRREVRFPDTVQSLVTIQPDTKETLLWASLDTTDRLSHVFYDAEKETAYLLGKGVVYTARENAALAPCDSFLSGDVISAALLPSGMGMVVDSMLVIRDFTPENQAARQQLRVLCDSDRGENYRAFLEAHPEVDLMFVSPTEASCDDQFVQDMLLKNDKADVYVLSDLNLLDILKKKKYYVDMAADETIAALVGQMYPAFRSAWMDGEQIAAFPKETFMELLAYHRPTFETLGIAPPTTYDAYFDFCLAWYDQYADACPDAGLRALADDLTLEGLLSRYADEQMRMGNIPTFHTEAMVQLVKKFLAVEKLVADNAADWRGKTSVFYTYDLPILDGEDEYGYLPLSFSEENQPTLVPQAGDVSFFVVNPYSSHTETALVLIASCDAQRTEMETALLYANIHESMESKLFASEYARMQSKLEALKAQLEAASPEAQRDLADQVAEQERFMENYAQTSRWAISKEALACYAPLSDLIFLGGGNPIQLLSGSMPVLPEGVDDQAIASFLDAVDQKVRMVLMEQNGQ